MPSEVQFNGCWECPKIMSTNLLILSEIRPLIILNKFPVKLGHP